MAGALRDALLACSLAVLLWNCAVSGEDERVPAVVEDEQADHSILKRNLDAALASSDAGADSQDNNSASGSTSPLRLSVGKRSYNSRMFVGKRSYDSRMFLGKRPYDSRMFVGKRPYGSRMFVGKRGGPSQNGCIDTVTGLNICRYLAEKRGYDSRMFVGKRAGSDDVISELSGYPDKRAYNSRMFVGKRDDDSDEIGYPSPAAFAKRAYNGRMFIGKRPYNSRMFVGKRGYNGRMFIGKRPYDSRMFVGKREDGDKIDGSFEDAEEEAMAERDLPLRAESLEAIESLHDDAQKAKEYLSLLEKMKTAAQ